MPLAPSGSDHSVQVDAGRHFAFFAQHRTYWKPGLYAQRQRHYAAVMVHGVTLVPVTGEHALDRAKKVRNARRPRQPAPHKKKQFA